MNFRYIGLAICLVTFISFFTSTSAMPQANDASKTYLALGDSYTIGESVASTDRFPMQTVAQLKQEGIYFQVPEIIAVTGWTTGELIHHIEKNPPEKQPYDLVSLLIGVNNQYQGKSLEEYKGEFSLLLEKSIRFAGGRPGHVIVLSIPDYSVTPFSEGGDRVSIARAIDSFNRINRALSLQYQVHYIGITEDSRKARSDASLVAEDGLHFSGKEYALWADKLSRLIRQVME
jgi:lysophospholipase L1-like esterase